MFSKKRKYKEGEQMKNNIALIAMIMSLAIFGCTKEKPYEFVPLKETLSKDLFNKEDFKELKPEEIAKLSPEEKRQYRAPRIAVMSYGQATRTSSASMPYFMGRTKLVEFEMTEKHLEVRELEKDPRFSDNPTNSKKILQIPVTHISYTCKKDAYGECLNEEIEDDETPWEKRPLVIADLERTQILDADELPVEITNLFSGCYSELGEQKVISREISKGVFNIEIEKSYRLNLTSLECISQISDFENLFENLNFDVRYVYSIVQADLLASKDYKAIEYTREDEGTFGFFDSKNKVLDVDGNEVENTDKVFLNRWNPEKKIIPYYLSKEFDKPENDYVLAATIQAVKNINNGLAQANAGIQIHLQKSDGKQKVGDLRNNMIVLVEDPLASRIIGYGPSVAHPSTGEIVNARTVMYLGTIRALEKKTYEEIREELIAAQREEAKRVKSGTLSAQFIENAQNSILQFTNGKSFAGLNQRLAARNLSDALQTSVSRASTVNTFSKSSERPKIEIGKNTGQAEHIKDAISQLKKLESNSLLARESKYIDKRIDILSKHNIYPEELFNARYALQSAGIERQLETTLKPWDQLTSAQKEEIIRAVLPHIWIPTLVHELGHNLGLRHNFAGSEDKENFYTAEELGKMGIGRGVPYSSVMEYSYKTMNELPTMGKYDIAALRFAYSREVETKDGKLVKVERNLEKTVQELSAQGQELKSYKFCTDEHASANPTCNRFDEGTNYTEITEHLISAYEDNYKQINRRNHRRNFSTMQEGAYLGRIKGNFYDLRLMYELYERIKNDFGIVEGHDLWKTDEFLADIYRASTIAGQFFLSNLLTPDTQCAIALSEEPTVPVAILPLLAMSNAATTCYHPDVQRFLQHLGKENGGLNLVIAGEGGKSFQTRKDSLNKNAYQDQVDVQGVWIDKLLSLEFFFARQLGSSLFDKHTQNFLDHGAVGPLAENILAAILLQRGTISVPFRDAEGFAVEFEGENGEVTSSLPVQLEFGEEHYINVPDVSGLLRYFNLPNEQTTFQKQIITALRNLVPSQVHSVSSRKFLQSFAVYREYPGDENAASVEIAGQAYFALPANKVAWSAIQGLGYAQVLEGIARPDIQKLLQMIEKGEKLPENAPEQIKKAYALGKDVLTAALNGYVKDQNTYAELISSLIPVVK